MAEWLIAVVDRLGAARTNPAVAPIRLGLVQRPVGLRDKVGGAAAGLWAQGRDACANRDQPIYSAAMDDAQLPDSLNNGLGELFGAA